MGVPINRRDFLALAGGFAASATMFGVAGWVTRMVGGPPSAPTVVGGWRAADGSIAAICKEAWGAAPERPGFVPHTIERLTVHHTAVRLDSNTQAPGRARQHQRFHQDSGWPDLAYHFLVDADGNVYEGRPLDYRGDTFTSYDPTGHFLVVCEGNFDEHTVPDLQLAGLADVLAFGAAAFAVEPATISGHRDWASTTCPGAALAPLIDNGTVQSMVVDRLNAGIVELSVVCGVDADDAVAAIESGQPLPQLAPAGGRFHLKHTNGTGPADETFPFGEDDWIPVAGRFGLDS